MKNDETLSDKVHDFRLIEKFMYDEEDIKKKVKELKATGNCGVCHRIDCKHLKSCWRVDINNIDKIFGKRLI